ncbi:carboxypeptidase-like regulatory domain-containing protein [Parasediminibacterium paludis]|uniref:Carboxypeptidase-like regulatory domain-containing protein n=1 Tax=Parasediminibacterium paludis TaxID=908966 RepID=A0ABV8PWE1_9BACT
MMQQLKKLTFLVLLLPMALLAQVKPKHTVNGTIRDKQTGETLIGANVKLTKLAGLGTVSNAYGFYSITAEEGSYTLVVSFAGYVNDTIALNLTKNTELNIALVPYRSQLEEVVVSTRKKNDNITKAVMGVQKLSINEIKNVPVIFGEKDVLKTIQLLPGIKSAGEGNSGFYVRGGTSDQNLILLDEATVYNASHLLGFFSTFNSDAIKDITVYKGGMPAEYGGRLSSVIDIKTNDGNNQKFGMSGGIGLISSRLNAEGPIVKDKGSFNISARRTYADLFLALSKDSSIKNNKLYFYDLNGKANYKLNDKNRLFLSIYNGRDNLGFGKTFGIDYGNTTATLRLNHIYNTRLFSNTSLIYTNYNYNIKITAGNNNLLITSKIRDFNVKQDFQYYINGTNKVNFGLDFIHHNLVPGNVTASQQSSFNNTELQTKYSVESALYVSHEWSATDEINLTYGLRVSMFNALGPGNFYSYDAAGNVIDTATYNSGQIVKTYVNLQPRFATSYKLNDKQSIKLSYSRNVQNIHLLSNSTSANPTDLYVGSSNNIKPEIADQVALGYYQNFKENAYEFSAEVYYKALQNQIDYKNGAELRANENVESQLLFGRGRAYGLELFFKKKYGKLNGWVGYTLSKTERQFDQINNVAWYNATQDRTHELSVVGIYQASKKWTVSATFVYYTGNAVTFPSGKYNINGQTVFYYTERNGYRMPNYHRLDIGATLQGKKTAKTDRSWTFSLYNAYGRENAFAINFREDPNNAAKTQAVQTTLFRWVPSVTYNFKF